MIKISKSFTYWQLKCHESYMLTGFEAKGWTLSEIEDNCEIYLETTRGGEGPHWKLGDLHNEDYEMVLEAVRKEYADEVERLNDEALEKRWQQERDDKLERQRG